jgi:type II secretion system protein I
MNKGFTLVELLIAMSILSIAILATFGAVSNNLRASNFAQDQVTAYYLADEGIEYIHNLRDTNGIANTQAISTGSSVLWLTGIAQSPGDPCFGGAACAADSPLNTLTLCPGGASGCPYLRIDTTTGLYGYTPTWTLTPFQRVITVRVISANEAVVTSTVTWTTNSVTKTYGLSETLENWE